MGLNTKATLTSELRGVPSTEAGLYFQARTDDVATDVKEAMSRGTSVPVTSPLTSSDTSTTTIPLAMLPTGNWTSVAKVIFAGWKGTCASVERAQQDRMVARTKIDGSVFILIRRTQILTGWEEILTGNLKASKPMAQERARMCKSLQNAVGTRSKPLDQQVPL